MSVLLPLRPVCFFKYTLQKGNPGQRCHIRGFDQPHNSLMEGLWSLVAGGFPFPTARYAEVPLAYCREEDIAAFASLMDYPIIPCGVCGAQPHLKRKHIKRLISELSADIPMFRGTMLSALGRVIPSHLLDNKLFDFKKLGETADTAGRNPHLPPVKFFHPQ